MPERIAAFLGRWVRGASPLADSDVGSDVGESRSDSPHGGRVADSDVGSDVGESRSDSPHGGRVSACRQSLTQQNRRLAAAGPGAALACVGTRIEEGGLRGEESQEGVLPQRA